MHQLFLAALMAGLISGGAFALSTVPAAALVYTWIVVLGMGGALLLAAYSVFETVAFMLCVYAVFLSRNICAHGQLFIDRLHDELKLEAQRELIGLLLNDFEEHTPATGCGRPTQAACSCGCRTALPRRPGKRRPRCKARRSPMCSAADANTSPRSWKTFSSAWRGARHFAMWWCRSRSARICITGCCPASRFSTASASSWAIMAPAPT